jgi:hypothetical protein
VASSIQSPHLLSWWWKYKQLLCERRITISTKAAVDEAGKSACCRALSVCFIVTRAAVIATLRGEIVATAVVINDRNRVLCISSRHISSLRFLQ